MSVVRSAFASRAAVGRVIRVGGLAERVRGDPLGELCDALGLVAITAELLVKQQRVQPIEPRLERRLPIGFPEEPRVAQPRGHDPLGVLRDQPFVRRLRVDDREERFLQLARRR